MTIQDLKQNDLKSIIDLQPTDWSDILLNFEFYTNSEFCFPIKVIVDNKIVGVGTTIIHNDISWLAHIIVHKDYRNNGIGKLLTQTLVNNSRNKKCDSIYLIATDLGAIVYEKLGFETDTEYLFFKDIKSNSHWTKSKNISLFSEDLKDQIINLDKLVSGEDSFFHIESHLKNGYVYKKDNLVEGFYLPSFGDGLIIAKTDSAGIELMKLRLLTKENAVFPSDNLIATAFMNHNNYKISGKAKRMRLGRKRPIFLSNIYNRIGGNLG